VTTGGAAIATSRIYGQQGSTSFSSLDWSYRISRIVRIYGTVTILRYGTYQRYRGKQVNYITRYVSCKLATAWMRMTWPSRREVTGDSCLTDLRIFRILRQNTEKLHPNRCFSHTFRYCKTDSSSDKVINENSSCLQNKRREQKLFSIVPTTFVASNFMKQFFLTTNSRPLWNPGVSYRTHRSPPPLPIPSQINPLHAHNQLLDDSF